MQEVLLVIHLIIALGIIAVVLIQPSEAGGFLGTGSMSNMMAPRRKADGLTRTTTILAGLFFATSLLLAITAQHRPAQKSIMDEMTDASVTTEAAAPVSESDETAPAEPAADEKAEAEKQAEPADDAPKAPIAK